MITPELVQKLKEAGFPETTDYYGVNPTLSDLIEACGSELRLQSFYSDNDLMWQADTCFNFGHYNSDDLPVAEVGYTPEEAVANLWLALNKKSPN